MHSFLDMLLYLKALSSSYPRQEQIITWMIELEPTGNVRVESKIWELTHKAEIIETINEIGYRKCREKNEG